MPKKRAAPKAPKADTPRRSRVKTPAERAREACTIAVQVRDKMLTIVIGLCNLG